MFNFFLTLKFILNYKSGSIVGYWVSGAAIYSAVSTKSYNNQNVWHYVSAFTESRFDLDVCSGRTEDSGDYSHKQNSKCLSSKVGDSGLDHSPVVGWMLDGYPIHGKFQEAYEVTESCWKKRVYTGGVGSCSDNLRSCILNDPFASSSGTTPSASAGPLLSDSITTNTSNSILAESGVFFEDYYFDTTCQAQGSKYLDVNNGHDHDSYGYHYHITSSFPFTAGPQFYGCLDTGTCCTTANDAFSLNACTGSSTCGASLASSVYTCGVPTALSLIHI